MKFETVANHASKFFRRLRNVIERGVVGKDLVKDDATGSRFEDLTGFDARFGNDARLLVLNLFQVAALGHSHLNAGVQMNFSQGVSEHTLVDRREDHPFADDAWERIHRDVIASHNDILRRTDNRLAACGAEDVVGGEHQGMSFDLRFKRKGKVNGHLVAVEVGVESLANERMQLDGVSFDEHRFESLDTHAV